MTTVFLKLLDIYHAGDKVFEELAENYFEMLCNFNFVMKVRPMYLNSVTCTRPTPSLVYVI